MIKLNKYYNPQAYGILSEKLVKASEQQLLLTFKLNPVWELHNPEEIKLIYFVKTKKFYLIGTPHKERRCCDGEIQEEKQVQVSNRWVINIFRKLETEKIPLYPEIIRGADGIYLELEIGGYTGKATYRWWCVPPKGWEILSNIANTIYFKFNKKKIEYAAVTYD